jgi:hypothetical protein
LGSHLPLLHVPGWPPVVHPAPSWFVCLQPEGQVFAPEVQALLVPHVDVPGVQAGTQELPWQLKPLLQLPPQQACPFPPQALQLPPWQLVPVALQLLPQHCWLRPPHAPHAPPLQIWLFPQDAPSPTLVQLPFEQFLQEVPHPTMPSVQQVELVTQRLPQGLKPLGHWPLHCWSLATHSVPHSR